MLFKVKKYIWGANFPHLQPMAELWRNQRGEIVCQHVVAHSCSHFSSCFDHTLSTQTDDGTSQIDHDIEAYVPYSLRTISQVLLRPLPSGVQGWRKQGQQLNITPQWCNHLNWEKGFTASMNSPVFLKTLVDGLAGVWTHDPAQQTRALSTELTWAVVRRTFSDNMELHISHLRTYMQWIILLP